MTNREIAQEISNRIGNSPIPFDSVYSIALQIYNELGGDETQFDSVYSILLEILPLVEGGIASKVIDDSTISTEKTWSSSKINEEIQAVGGTADSEFDGKTTEDFRFVTELPLEATEGEQVVIKGENVDTLYKYVSGTWVEQTPDANILYFDTENEALYSYVSAEQQFATISSVSTIVVGKNLNTSEALKAIKTPGTYSVLQRTSSSTKGEYTKKWTLTVEGIDYEEYELTDSIYQRMQSNYTIYKRTWSSTRATNDGWSNFSTYYAGEIKDSNTSKYYTWSSNKLNALFADINAVTDVDALPDAEANKGKLVRYEGKVYYVKPEEFKAVKFTALEDGSSVGLAKLATNQTLESSLDGKNWSTFDTTTTISLNSGESVFVRGILSADNTSSDYTNFAMSGKIAASGNINTLWDYTAEDLGTGFQLKNYCGWALFNNCLSLVIVDELYLPSMHLAEHCYGSMFSNVGFDADTKIEMLPATTLATGCYQYMFLTNNRSAKMPRIAPILPAPTLVEQCYMQMFSGGRIAESDMTNYIKCLATSGFDATYALSNFARSSSTGTFVKATAANDWPIGNNGIPTGWEVVNDDTLPEYTWHNVITYKWAEIPEVLEAGTNIDITNNTVSAKGYTYDDTIGSIKQHNVAYGDNPSTEDNNIATGTNCAVFGQGNTASSKCTFVAGESNSASSSYAVAVGYGNTVSKAAAVAFGRENTVAGQGGFAEGYKNNLTGQYAHAEGRENTAAGFGSHVEGYKTSATAQSSHAEGQSTSATSTGAHAEGETTQATGIAAHAEGFGSPTYGANVASGNGSHVEGIVTIAQNFGEHAEGCSNISHKASDTYGDLGNTQHSVGIGEAATKKNALEIMQNGDHYIYGIGGYVGTDTKVQNASIKTLQEVVNGKQDVLTAGQNISIDASNNISAEGYIFDASKGSFAEQYFDDDNNVIATNIATGIGSHAGGCGNTASGNYGSHAEGYGNTASGECSHAEGFNNTASGNYGSHAEGYGNTASSDCAHAEGGNNVASSYYAHAEGQNNTASGNSSHTEGAYNTASGTTSHAEGWYTIALNQTEHAEGQTNLSHKASDNYGNAGNTQHSVGIGVSPNRKNAFEIMQNGDMYVYGIGGYVGTNTTVQDSTIKTLQEYIASLEARIAALEGNTTVE